MLLVLILLLLSHRLDSARLESQLGVNGLHLHIRNVSIYRKMLIYQMALCGTNSYNVSISSGTSP